MKLEKQAVDEVLFDIEPNLENEHTEPQDLRIGSHPISFLSNKQASTLHHLNSESIAAWKSCMLDHFVAGIKHGGSVASSQLVLALIPVRARSVHSYSMEGINA